MKITIHFLLVPDKYAARQVRRRIAEAGGRLGVVVGTWLELLRLARENYLIVERNDDWNSRLEATMAGMPEAFWSASLRVAPAETRSSVGQMFLALIEGGKPGKRLGDCAPTSLQPRARKHFRDLAALQDRLAEALPPCLKDIHEILVGGLPLKALKVYQLPGFPELNRWQEELLTRLASDAADYPSDDSLQEILNSSLLAAPAAKEGCALSHMQENLFGSRPTEVEPDSSLQWLTCRDGLEEVEVVVGMIRQLLKDDPSLTLSEIGVMLPGDSTYARNLKEVAGYAGLPLSGLELELGLRDLGREAVMLFISTRRQPAPVMGLASLLSQPLMPWSLEEGMTLAQKIMSGHFEFEPLTGMDRKGRQMLALIGEKVETGADLKTNLAGFVELLAAPEEQAFHLTVAQTLVAELIAELGEVGEPPWPILISRCSPQPATISAPLEDTRDGLCIFYEGAEPWRRLRHLFVLGFGSGHYPAEPSPSAVFSEADLVILRNVLRIEVDCADELLARRRKLFKRQVAAVSDRINFLIPCRDYFGGELAPSSSLTFMAMLIAGVKEPEELLLNLDREADRVRIIGLPEVTGPRPVPPRKIKIADLDLGFDLMTIGIKDNGDMKTQSPSSLGTLLTSPLAWLFNRSGIEPREWQPEELDIMTKGTLAHDVFEHLFPARGPFPSSPEIVRLVPVLLNRAIGKNCPFLHTPEWHVERHHLEREIIDAAQIWTVMLTDMGATIMGAELGLRGEFEGLPIYGRADLIIELPGNRAMVIDFKKSKSKSRREQMANGYDSQAELYRQMLKTGGFTDEKIKPADGLEIGVMYYLMNDQVALCDSQDWFCSRINGLEELGDGISEQAIALLKTRIAGVRKGLVRLNRDTDEKWFEQNGGIKIYALNNSPLLRIFMLPGEEGSDEIA